MPLQSSWVVVVVVSHYHYSTHQNHLGSCMSVPPSERIELLLIHIRKLVPQAEHVQRKTELEQKFNSGQHNILELRIFVLSSRLRGFMTPRCITRQRFRATGYPNWNQKLRLSRWEEFGMGVLFWWWGTKNSQLKH
jgi:hypothetical protein